MGITVDDILRLGLDALLEYLGFSDKEELIDFMVEHDCPTLDRLALVLSDDTVICSTCGQNYTFVLNSGICDYCLDNASYNRGWR